MKNFYVLLLVFYAYVLCPTTAIELSSLHKKLTSENLPLILAESLAILENYYDISSCLPFSVTKDRCLATQKCDLPPLKVSPILSLNLRGKAKLCLKSLVLTPTLYVNNADVNIQPFPIHIKNTNGDVQLSFKVRAEIAGKGIYRLFLGTYRVSAEVKIQLQSDEIKKEKLHYKFHVKYNLLKKNPTTEVFACLHCHKRINKRGMLDVSPFLRDIL